MLAISPGEPLGGPDVRPDSIGALIFSTGDAGPKRYLRADHIALVIQRVAKKDRPILILSIANWVR